MHRAISVFRKPCVFISTLIFQYFLSEARQIK
jgi:hypothetical protein